MVLKIWSLGEKKKSLERLEGSCKGMILITMKSKLGEEKKLKEERRSRGIEGLVLIKKSFSWGS